MRALFTYAIGAAEILGTDKSLKQLTDLRAQLPPNQVRDARPASGWLEDWDAEQQSSPHVAIVGLLIPAGCNAYGCQDLRCSKKLPRRRGDGGAGGVMRGACRSGERAWAMERDFAFRQLAVCCRSARCPNRVRSLQARFRLMHLRCVLAWREDAGCKTT